MSLSKEIEEKTMERQRDALRKLKMSEFKYHKLSVDDTVKDLNTSLSTGLSSRAVEQIRTKVGPNKLDEEPEKSLWESILEQFEDLLVRILLGSAIITFIFACLSDEDEGIAAFVEPFVILTILVLNAVVAIWQDRNADSALEALKNMQASNSYVLRDGKWSTVPAEDLVPGDVIEVKVGECVPADLRVAQIKSICLQAGQAALTGESVSVQKTLGALSESATMLQDQKNMLFSSTTITNGVAIGVVCYTGMKTAIGNVHSEVQAAKEEEEDTPLKVKLDQFSELLAKIIFVICFLV